MSVVGSYDGGQVFTRQRYVPLPRYGMGFLAVDAGYVAVCGSVTLVDHQILDPARVSVWSAPAGLLFSASLLFAVLGHGAGLYARSTLDSFPLLLCRLALTWLLTLAVLAPLAASSGELAGLPRETILSFATAALLGTLGYRLVYYRFRDALRLQAATQRRTVCVLGARGHYDEAQLHRRLTRAGYDISAFVEWTSGCETDAAEAVAAAMAQLRGSDLQEILVAADLTAWAEIRGPLRAQPLPVRLIASGDLERALRQPVCRTADVALLQVQCGPLTEVQTWQKRAIDIAVAGSALLMLAPLLVLIGLAIKLDSQGPVIFQQRRRGFNGRDFRIFKFRTMRVCEDGTVVQQATRRDPRVTRVGRLLRSTSLDELPQLLNVLRGEMSIVGPRPHAVAHDTHFEQVISNYGWRHHVKPGLTGWAQIHGLRGEIRQHQDMKRRVDHDVWYASNYSVPLDVKIILSTFRLIFKWRDVY